MLAGDRVLILGATGMLGHKLAQVFSPSSEVIAAVRGDASRWPGAIRVAEVVGNVDVRNTECLSKLMDRCEPTAVLNAVGVVKQILGAHDPLDTMAINAIYPNILSLLCEARKIKLIHYSTDCVFTGSEAGVRGPNGYRENDPADSRDLYGMSKLLGEPTTATSLTFRTSIIGRELRGGRSLVEWFLAQGSNPTKGYTKALFTGLPTVELARITQMVLRDHPEMSGVWHVAAPPINKFELLGLIRNSFGRETPISADSAFYCDRRLDGSRFSGATGWSARQWPEMIDEIRTDSFDYEALVQRS